MSKPFLYAMVAGAVVSISLALNAAMKPPFQDGTVNIPYQGFLQQNGVAYTTGGSGIAIAVMLYDGDATNPFFTDSFSAVQVNSGHFSVVLGQAAGNPLLPEFFNGTPVNVGGTPVTVVGPIKVGVSIGGSLLSGRQTLFPAPYAQVANYANQSADTFKVGTQLSAPSASVTALSATNITGSTLKVGGPLDGGVADPLVVSGPATVTGGVRPNYDSGWIYVKSTTGDYPFHYGWSDSPPSNLMLLQCGALPGNPQPALTDPQKNFEKCATQIIYAGVRGYKDSISAIEPQQIIVDATNGIADVRLVGDHWVFGYVPTGSDIFACPGDPDPTCRTGYYRLFVWK